MSNITYMKPRNTVPFGVYTQSGTKVGEIFLHPTTSLKNQIAAARACYPWNRNPLIEPPPSVVTEYEHYRNKVNNEPNEEQLLKEI